MFCVVKRFATFLNNKYVPSWPTDSQSVNLTNVLGPQLLASLLCKPRITSLKRLDLRDNQKANKAQWLITDNVCCLSFTLVQTCDPPIPKVHCSSWFSRLKEKIIPAPGISPQQRVFLEVLGVWQCRVAGCRGNPPVWETWPHTSGGNLSSRWRSPTPDSVVQKWKTWFLKHCYALMISHFTRNLHWIEKATWKYFIQKITY